MYAPHRAHQTKRTTTPACRTCRDSSFLELWCRLQQDSNKCMTLFFGGVDFCGASFASHVHHPYSPALVYVLNSDRRLHAMLIRHACGDLRDCVVVDGCDHADVSRQCSPTCGGCRTTASSTVIIDLTHFIHQQKHTIRTMY